MACTEPHCYLNCFIDSCSPHAAACVSNETDFGIAVIIGDLILASHVNTLRDSIDEERIRRSLLEDFDTTVDIDDIVEEQHMTDMKDSINDMGGNVTDTYSGLVYANEINNLRTEINDLRIDCQCDTDCGANLICTCHGHCGIISCDCDGCEFGMG